MENHSHQWSWVATAAMVVLVLTGCKPEWADQADSLLTYPFRARQTAFTKADLEYAAYTQGYTGPAGMYIDAYTPFYYENTLSIGDLDHSARELCTDDYDQAKAWVDLHSDPSQNLGERQDLKFFEFKRVHPQLAAMHYRVHRCAYVDVYARDLLSPLPERGTFNLRPLTPEAVEELAEYLWYLRRHDTPGFKVLSSFSDELPDALQHTLYYVSLSAGAPGLCDQIGLIRRITAVGMATGAIVENDEPVRTVEGHCH